jgi:hypothetical protein
VEAESLQLLTLSDTVLEGDRQKQRPTPQSEMQKIKARSDSLDIAPGNSAAGERAAKRTANKAHERLNGACHCETHAANAIALERRQLGLKVVNLEPYRQRHVPSMEVRRAEHGHVSKGFHLYQR